MPGAWIRRLLSPRLVTLLRQLNRFRWFTKIKVLRSYGVRARKCPLTVLRYLVMDPELDNFTYDLDNEDELGTFVSEAVDVSVERALCLIYELQHDRELSDEIRRRARWRFDAKRFMPFGGKRLAWYAMARCLKPSLVVEAGMKDGLGSLAILRALERNANEGAPGRLVSFDLSPDRGWLVGPRLRGGWEPVYESTYTALGQALAGRRVAMAIHDSEATYECERFEFELVLARAAPTTALFSNGQWSTALRDLCDEHGGRYLEFRERPRHPFYPGGVVALGIFGSASS